jgi:endogenous inhibitor of DNA gyrase (YacG/DUF329 family)
MASDTMTKNLTVKCPSCGALVEWSSENAFRPFCSQRCKQIDLGAWASESYRVPVSAPADTEEKGPNAQRD